MLNEKGQKVHFIDGVGNITHQCRDPGPLWSAVRESSSRPYDERVLHHSVRASDLLTSTEYFELPGVYGAG